MLDASSDSGLLPSIPKLLIKDSAPLQNTQPRGGPRPGPGPCAQPPVSLRPAVPSPLQPCFLSCKGQLVALALIS